MSPSERRTAVPDDATDDLTGELSGGRTEVDVDPAGFEGEGDRDVIDRDVIDRNERLPDTGPIELPEIVPATVDVPEPEPVARQTDDDTDRDPDEWVEMSDDQIVRVPPEAGAVLRPQGRRPRVRKVTRVLRHVDPWSTFKVALLFSVVLYVVVLTAGVLLWNVALTTGTVDNVERWFLQFGWETFELNGGEIYHNAWTAGLFAIVGLTGFAVLLATLFNLVSDIVGGVRLTVLEEEVVERTVSSTRRFVVRRSPTDPTWSPDDSPAVAREPG